MSGIVNKVKEVFQGESTHSNTVPEGTHGPHNTRIANAADPRIDSDLDSTGRSGATRVAGHGEYGSGAAYPADSAMSGSGMTGMDRGSRGTQGAYGTGPTVSAGGASTYDSNTSYGTTNLERQAPGSGATGITGTHGAPEGTYGPHSSRVANAADPRVDSDRDGRAAVGNAPGPAPNTAGPHRNDVLNKVDPRVDSDLDGSKTMGGNRTFQP